MIERYKYGRTYHFPWSLSVGSDDKINNDWKKDFQYKNIVITTKVDGENSCLYADGYTHARSIDNSKHESRDWLKSFWSERHYNLPTGWRVYGENMYAKHSIEYNDLPSYFLAFSIYDENNVRLSWDQFIEYCQLLDICTVPVLYEEPEVNYDDMYNDFYPKEMFIKSLFKKAVEDGQEGIVMTTYNGFHYDDMSKYLVKAVRRNHVATDEHWMSQAIIPNKLKEQ